MKKIETLKDMVAKDAKIIVEYQNNLNILGISKINECYVVSWYNKISRKDKHYVFNKLTQAEQIFNLLMNLQF